MTNRPQVLPPLEKELVVAPPGPPSGLRATYGPTLFGDENLDWLSHLLDDCFHIPGTPIRFGLDGIVGFIPGLGDVLGGVASCIVLIAGWFRGVPYVTLARMVANVGIEVAVGSVPILGNLFDIVFKANRRNYALLTRHIQQPHQHTWKDWVFLGLLVLALGAVLLAPLVLIVVLLARIKISY